MFNTGVLLAQAGSPCPKNSLDEWRRGGVHLFLWLDVTVKCVLFLELFLSLYISMHTYILSPNVHET